VRQLLNNEVNNCHDLGVAAEAKDSTIGGLRKQIISDSVQPVVFAVAVTVYGVVSFAVRISTTTFCAIAAASAVAIRTNTVITFAAVPTVA
jgi:hypothetical protein